MADAKPKILVVDDEPDLCEIICFELNDVGFETLVAGSGKEAQALVDSHPGIDVVISDVRMPDGSGMELLEYIKAKHPEKPAVLFVSGFTDISMEEAYDKGAEAIFTKPIDFPRLITVVKESILPKDERWSRRHSRVQVNVNVELTLPGLQKAKQSRTLNISRGGMYICLKENFPAMGSTIQFRILFLDRKWGPLEGEAVVRWVRKDSTAEMPAGIGVEFTHLSETTIKQLVSLLNEVRTRSWIPKN